MCWGGGGGLGGVCLICIIFLVVKLLTSFEAFVPPIKEFTQGVSVVISNGCPRASIVQMLKVVEVSTVQCAVFETIRNIHFCAVDRVNLVWDTYRANSLKASTRKNPLAVPNSSINWVTEKLTTVFVSR